MVGQFKATFAIAEDGVDPTSMPQRVLHTGAKMPAIGLGMFGRDDFERILAQVEVVSY